MGVVEDELLQDGEGGQLHQGPVEGGQLGATGVAPQGHQLVGPHHHGPRDAQVVEEDGLQGVDELLFIHLHR